MYHLRSQFLHSTIVYSLEVEHCIIIIIISPSFNLDDIGGNIMCRRKHNKGRGQNDLAMEAFYLIKDAK